MDTDALARLIDSLALPDTIRWAVSLPVADANALLGAEAEAIATAVPARRAEFIGGRAAARAALADLPIAPVPIPAGPDRAPIWPKGVVGSISHGGGLCLAVVARQSEIAALGVDLEPDTPLNDDVIGEIASAQDIAHFPGLPRAQAALRVFGAKEAAYKALYPTCPEIAGFDAIRMTGGGVAPSPLGPFADHPHAANLQLVQGVEGGMLLSLVHAGA